MTVRLLYLLFFFVTLDACQNPLDGVQLRLKDPLQESVVECRLYDPAGNPLPKNSRVILAGPDASRVVTTLNTTNFKINSDGVLLMAASPTVTPGPAQPLRFTVAVEADGYLAVVQPIVLTGPARQTRVLRQINLARPPRSLVAAQTNSRASTDGTLPTTLALTTAEQTPDADRATVTFAPGTKLTDRDGQPVGGNLTLAVLHTNTRTTASTSQVPGGGILSDVKPLPGQPTPGTLRITSIAGSVTFALYNEQYALVRSLSQPMRWTMELNPTTINGQKARAVQVGDTIPLYSYDAFTNRWQQEKPGIVARNNQTGRLEYRAEATHAAAYVATWTESVCDLGPVFRVNSKLANVDVNYRCQLVDARTNEVVGNFYANVNNGALIRVYNQVSGRSLKLRVYDETDAWGKGAKGGLMAESGEGITCDQTPVAINLSALPVPPAMKLEIRFACPKGTKLDEASLPALFKAQYSEVGKENWRDLLTATRTQRAATSYKLQVGKRYDFRASTDGGATWPLRQPNYLVDKADWTLKIEAEMYCK
ncbi:hypothetical protein [Spirosoma montaniterrae]|uniref:Uncharacterized protein n=1 Tax=Spirosoma montaniterrae TaxID=1178516 RepID=A0A1P9X186_9BACT|nr:hypothetical protein [Spirosoma montaniterrae]AQG81402.1 hypothetical protein AWR27_20010 [Spirosoma montaniterrae]